MTVQDFTIKRLLLDRMLAVTADCASGSIQPILGNVYIGGEAASAVTSKTLRVVTSNAMMSAVIEVNANLSGKVGGAVWPVSLLRSIVRECGEDVWLRATVKKGKYHGTVCSGSAKWDVPLMDPSGFPRVEISKNGAPVEAKGLLSALQRVHKAASRDSIKPYLMMVDLRKGKVRASDGIRFQQTKFAFPFDAQIPVQAIPELLKRLAATKSEHVFVAQSDRALFFTFGHVTLVIQKVMAQFPDVDEVLLKPALSNDLELLVRREPLVDAIRKVRLVADTETDAVVLSLNHGSVTVEAKDRVGSVATEEVPAEWAQAPRHVAFNHKHLTDLLGSATGEECVLRLGKDLKTKPTPLLYEDDGLLAVLSQIRLEGWLE